MVEMPMSERVVKTATVLYFLLGARDNRDMYNSHTADSAFHAACELLGVDPATLILKSKGLIQ